MNEQMHRRGVPRALLERKTYCPICNGYVFGQIASVIRDRDNPGWDFHLRGHIYICIQCGNILDEALLPENICPEEEECSRES